jgi:hypothetical protein
MIGRTGMASFDDSPNGICPKRSCGLLMDAINDIE